MKSLPFRFPLFSREQPGNFVCNGRSHRICISYVRRKTIARLWRLITLSINVHLMTPMGHSCALFSTNNNNYATKRRNPRRNDVCNLISGARRNKLITQLCAHRATSTHGKTKMCDTKAKTVYLFFYFNP